MKFINALLASARLATGVAQAQTVTAAPSAPEIAVGNSLTVDPVVSGRDDATVGSFDFIYDPFPMTSYGVVFGEGLDVFSLGSLFSVASVPGLINIAQTSFDATGDLIALQPDSFTLATLSFKAIGLGVIPLAVLVNAIGARRRCDAAGRGGHRFRHRRAGTADLCTAADRARHVDARISDRWIAHPPDRLRIPACRRTSAPTSGRG